MSEHQIKWERIVVVKIKMNVRDTFEEDELKARLNMFAGETDVSKSDGSNGIERTVSHDDDQDD